MESSHGVLVQMGHLQSKHLGGPERVVLQDAWLNQYDNVTLEHSSIGGAVLSNEAVDIYGIGVELRTAQHWEEIGVLPKGTVQNSRRID